MCGIVGVVNGKSFRNVSSKITGYMRDAMIVDSLRGADSTGMFQRSKNNKNRVWWHKKAVNGLAFSSDPVTVGLLRDADDSAFTIVHNRAATRGEVSDENAHPFEAYGEDGSWLMGVHNGTITGWEAAPDAKNYKVDSAWALAQIAEHGVEAFKKIQGAYTFVWYGDREGETINMIRNYARPMYVAYVKDQERLLFASEYMMMVWLAQRNELSLETDIIELEPGHLYSFSVDNPRQFTKTKVETFVTTPARDAVLFDSIEKLFSQKEQVKPAVTQSAKTVALVPTKKEKNSGNLGVAVTAREGRAAKQAELFGQVVTFFQEHYDVEARELWGTVSIKPQRGMTELFSAVIRHVDKATYDTWKRATSLSGKVIGAMITPIGNTSEMTLVISRSAKPESEDEKDMDAQLSKEISNILKVTINEDHQSKH